MVPLQETTGFQDEDIAHLIAYMLSLQGKQLMAEDVLEQMFSPDTETDRAIAARCEAEAIGDSDARDYLEDRYAKRYRDLLIGRPPDIQASRYIKNKKDCKKRLGQISTNRQGVTARNSL